MDNHRRKTAVITDITTEIGRNAAAFLADKGYQLTLCVPKGKRLETDIPSLNTDGGNPAVEVDFTDEADVLRLFQTLPSVQVLFYNTLPDVTRSRVSRISQEEFARFVEKDITSVVTAAKVFGTHMTNGSMIFLGSVHADKPNVAAPLYSMYMGALKNMVREAAVSFGTRKNRCNFIELGAMGGEYQLFCNDISYFYEGYSAKIPNGYVPTPQDISQIVWFLAENSAAVNGESIRADSGLVLAYLDKLTNARAYERMRYEGCGD